MFTFTGEKEPWSYEQMQRKRRLAEAMAGSIGTPRNVGEGLSSLGRALAARGLDKRADKREGELQEEADQLWGGVFSSLGGRAPASQTYAAPSPAVQTTNIEGAGVAADTMNALGINGAPKGLLHNESGGKTTAYNHEVGAGGVRGHGGRAQMGAARLEDAARAGVIPPMSPAQYAQQPAEIQDKVEAWHWGDIDKQIAAKGLDQYYGQTVGGVPITRDAVASMAHLGGVGGAAKFLSSDGRYNPSDVYGSSLAEYGSRFGGGGRTSPRSQASTQAIAEALSNPMIRNDPARAMILQTMLQQQLAPAPSMSPYQQAQLEMKRQELEMRASGKWGGGTNVTVNNADGTPAPQMGTIPQGYTAVPDPTNPAGYRMEAIPGGPEDSSTSDAATQSARDTASDNIITAASRARSAAGQRNGPTALTSVVGAINPYSDSAEVMRQVSVLKNITSAEQLNAMRRQSKTGGALGNVTERELGLLAEQGGALDPNSPNFERDLADYERAILRIIHGKEEGDAIFEQTRPQQVDADGWLDHGGVKIRVKQ